MTENYSWHWLFLINIIPGCIAMITAMLCLPRGKTNFALLKTLDWLSLLWMGLGLAILLIGLKEAPSEGWTSTFVLSCFAVVPVLENCKLIGREGEAGEAVELRTESFMYESC